MAQYISSQERTLFAGNRASHGFMQIIVGNRWHTNFTEISRPGRPTPFFLVGKWKSLRATSVIKLEVTWGKGLAEAH